MSCLWSFRRAARAASLVLAAVLVPAAARAQPACAADALAAYLAPGFACRVGAWAFDGFDFHAFADASAGVSAFAPDAALLDVLPFQRVGSGGHVEVGFDFLGLGSSVTTSGLPRGGERGTAFTQVSFLGRAVAPAAALLGARAELTALVDGTAPATTFVSAQSFARVDVFGGPPCLDVVTSSPGGPGFVLDAHAGACAGGPALSVSALLGNVALLDGDDRPATLFGFTAGTVQSVTFVTAQVVPEPSTVTLAAAGLLGLVGATARRRAVARRATRPRSVAP